MKIKKDFNKEGFLKELALYLHTMKDDEKNKYVTYYEELISDYIENGMSEEEAVIKIGDAQKVAKELLDSYDNIKINIPSTGNRVLNLVLVVLGFPLWGSLLMTGILFLISIYIILWCVPVATGAGCIGFFLSSLVGIMGSPFIMIRNFSIGILQLGSGIAFIGLSILLGIVTIDLSKKLVVITKRFNLVLVSLLKKRVVL